MKRRNLGWMLGFAMIAMIAGHDSAMSQTVAMPDASSRPPFIVVQQIEQSREVAPSISTYKVDAKVNGLFATVTTEFTITNSNNREMEGELTFPLPENAVVSGYAIDIGGVMTEAQIVEKKNARIIFENVTRQSLRDPGPLSRWKNSMNLPSGLNDRSGLKPPRFLRSTMLFPRISSWICAF